MLAERNIGARHRGDADAPDDDRAHHGTVTRPSAGVSMAIATRRFFEKSEGT